MQLFLTIWKFFAIFERILEKIKFDTLTYGVSHSKLAIAGSLAAFALSCAKLTSLTRR